jgi:hypothetical protein
MDELGSRVKQSWKVVVVIVGMNEEGQGLHVRIPLEVWKFASYVLPCLVVMGACDRLIPCLLSSDLRLKGCFEVLSRVGTVLSS